MAEFVGNHELARILKLGFLADFLSRTVLIGFLTGVETLRECLAAYEGRAENT